VGLYMTHMKMAGFNQKSPVYVASGIFSYARASGQRVLEPPLGPWPQWDKCGVRPSHLLCACAVLGIVTPLHLWAHFVPGVPCYGLCAVWLCRDKGVEGEASFGKGVRRCPTQGGPAPTICLKRRVHQFWLAGHSRPWLNGCPLHPQNNGPLCTPKPLLASAGTGLHSEQLALLDLLVLSRARLFVGDGRSSFSGFTQHYRVLHGFSNDTFINIRPRNKFFVFTRRLLRQFS
jgi:hypothetical protein